MSRSTTEHQLLLNRYRVEEFLGQGGMARVHRGTDLVLDRTVAVKILAPNLARDQQAVRRFRREAQAAAGLGHPGIVAVYDTGSDDGIHFIVMEFVTGQTLADILEQAGALPPDRAIDVAVAVATALSHAHGKGIVHRDVKPGNIMITPSDEVKVMDFGIARAVNSATFTNTGSVIGTATYFAPEQARGGPVDERTDIYALGVVLYEMLTGRPPFKGDSPVAVAYQHVQEEPAPPSHGNPVISPALEAVVLKAMAKDPGARHQNAAELAAELERVGGGGTPPPMVPPSAGPITQPVPVQGTAVLPPVAVPPATAAGRPPSHRSPRRERRWAPWLLALAALLTSALIGTLVVAELSRPPAVNPGPTSRPVTQSPSPTPTPATTSPSQRPFQGTLSVQGALDRLALILDQGVAAGDISSRDANEIAREIRDAIRTYEDGDLEGATAKLRDLQSKVGEREQKGEIEPDIAARLAKAISDVAVAMEADPPPSPPDDDDD